MFSINKTMVVSKERTLLLDDLQKKFNRVSVQIRSKQKNILRTLNQFINDHALIITDRDETSVVEVDKIVVLNYVKDSVELPLIAETILKQMSIVSSVRDLVQRIHLPKNTQCISYRK